MALRTRLFDNLERYGYSSLGELARDLGWHSAHLGRLRAGKRPITETFVIAVLRLLRTQDPRTSPTREELFYDEDT